MNLFNNLKLQKQHLISQIQAVEKLLWPEYIKEEDRDKIKNMYIEDKIACPLEWVNTNEIHKLGLRTTDKQQIVFNPTGTACEFKIHYTYILEAEDEIKKHYPEKVGQREPFNINKSTIDIFGWKHKPKSNSKRTSTDIALNRGSLERNLLFYNNAKDNLEEAKRALKVEEEGVANRIVPDKRAITKAKNLVEVFQKEFDKETEILNAANKIDWEVEYAQKEMRENQEVTEWLDKYKESSSFYQNLGFYSFNPHDFLIAKKYDLLNQGYTFEQVKLLIDIKENNKSINDYKKELELNQKDLEQKLQERFARKDGNGLVKPKTRMEEVIFNQHSSQINRSSWLLRIIKSIEQK